MRKTFFLWIFLWHFLSAHAGQPPVMASYEGEALKFVENKGQWHQDVLYRAELPAGYVYLLRDGIYYDLYESSRVNELLHHRHEGTLGEIDSTIHHHGVKVSFIGALEDFTHQGFDPYPEKINYLIGNDPSKWGRNVKAFNGVLYKNIYPNIDLKIEMNGVSFKYEFIVHPGGDPEKIALKFKGQEEVSIVDKRLVVKTSVMSFIENPPSTYQSIEGKKEYVKNKYHLEEDIITFNLKKYNEEEDLVIDPELIFSTYSGSTADNWGNTATVDKEGNLYTGGTVFGTDLVRFGNSRPNGFPATTGAFQTTFQGGHTDIGIIKFDSSGTFAYYATYIGGNNSEIPTSIITNDEGELYILGTTGSNNFPMADSGAFKTFSGGTIIEPVGGYFFTAGTDIVVCKLSKNGDSLLTATYMGGSANDGLNAAGILPNRVDEPTEANPVFQRSINDLTDASGIAINYGDELRGDINLDAQGNVYVASSTQSSNFPVKNAFQPTFGGVSDAVTFKLTPNLDSLVWSSYLGGSEAESGTAINKDSLDNIYVVGATRSLTDFPVTDTLPGYDANENMEGYVAWIENDGDSILASVKVGTSGFDQVYFVQIGPDGHVYLLGQNVFGEYPITSGVYNVPREGVFIHKLKSTLDSTFFSTTIGDTQNNTIAPNFSPTAFLVNDCGNLFISGWGGITNYGYSNDGGATFTLTYTADLPTFNNISFIADGDGSDFYLAVLEKEAKSLIYSTYYGSSTSAEHVDGGTSRFDKKGIVYQSVCAGCGGDNNFPLAPTSGGGSYPRANLSRNCNNGVFKFDLASLNAEIAAPSGCLPLEVTFENNTLGGIDYFWDFGDGKDTLVLNTSDITHVYDTTGQYTVKMIATDKTTCIGKDSTEITIFVNGKKPNTAFRDTTCRNVPITLKADTNDVEGKNDYQWFPSTFLNDDDIQNPVSTPTSSIQYLVTITDSLGCVQIDTFKLSVHNLDLDIDPHIFGSCSGFPKVKFENSSNAIPPSTYLWNFGDGETGTEEEPEHQYNSYDSIVVTVNASDKYCTKSAQLGFKLVDGEVPNIITPNGDGVNECFQVPRTENSGNWNLTIHNRWGDLIFETDKYQGQWCGENLSDGTYYYLLISPDGERCKGWVEILR